MSGTTTPAGSYDPAATVAGGFGAEVARLEAQADLSWADERRALQSVLDPGAGTLLDVGCGSGAWTRRLSAWWPGPVVGLDHDVRLLRHAGAGAHRAVGVAERLPVADGSMAVTVSRFVLQHVVDPECVVRELVRVTAPGGRVAVVDVDAEMWGAAQPPQPGFASVHRKVAAAQRERGGDRTIVRRLPRLLQAAGCTDVTVVPFATTSDTRPMADFEPHLGPSRMLPYVESGHLEIGDLAAVTAGWQRFCRDPDAWVMVLGFVVAGRVPAR